MNRTLGPSGLPPLCACQCAVSNPNFFRAARSARACSRLWSVLQDGRAAARRALLMRRPRSSSPGSAAAAAAAALSLVLGVEPSAAAAGPGPAEGALCVDVAVVLLVRLRGTALSGRSPARWSSTF